MSKFINKSWFIKIIGLIILTGLLVGLLRLAQSRNYRPEENTARLIAKGLALLKDAQKRLEELKPIAENFNNGAEAALQHVARLEEEQVKLKKSFETLQETAIQAHLPKSHEATAEDKAKIIVVDGKNLTGESVYNILKQYKSKIEKNSKIITREQERAIYLKSWADNIVEKYINKISDNIDTLEWYIEEMKWQLEVSKTKQKLKLLGFSDQTIEEELLTVPAVLWEKSLKDLNDILEQDDKQTLSTDANINVSNTDDDLH